ncbi:MAG: hypothetical protein JWP44_3769 [Mucilaginibacter sp.]|nr:hypothetical protein [Mucilaginibacter sp.]
MKENKLSGDLNLNVKVENPAPEPAPPERFLGMSTAGLDFFKWIIGTVILGAAGLWINCSIQTHQLKLTQVKDSVQLRLQQMEVDSKLITAVSEKFDDQETDQAKNHQKEINYLQFIITFVSTDSLVKNIHNRLNSLNGVITTNNLKQVVPDAATITQKTSQLSNGLSVKLQKDAAHAPKVNQSMTQFNTDQENLVKTSPTGTPLLDTNQTTAVLTNINKAAVTTVPGKIENNFYLAVGPQTLYCKAGYFVVFNNALRVDVNATDPANQVATVGFKKAGTNDLVDPSLASVVLSKNAPLTVDYGGYRYQVNLSYIGHAGINPFTQAAYITVTVYQQQAVPKK